MTWNPSIPAVANQISADIPDIKENFEHLAFWTDKRSIFVYNGGTTAYSIKVGAGCYYCKDKVAYWVSELTTDAIGTPSGDTWYYLYIDNSAITSGTLVTKDELIWATTAPSYSQTYGGWYNGSDRCIFACLTNHANNNILEFYHDGGDKIFWADGIAETTTWAPSNTWTDVDCASSVPGFSTRTHASFYGSGSDDRLGYIRRNGQAGTSGILVFCKIDGEANASSADVLLDSTQIFEFKFNGATTANMNITVNAWYLPAGM